MVKLTKAEYADNKSRGYKILVYKEYSRMKGFEVAHRYDPDAYYLVRRK
jgi:hypothetical protein